MKQYFVIFGLIFFLIQACKKDKSDANIPNPNGPKDSVTNFMVTIFDTQDSMVKIANYSDVDGPGPKRPLISGFSFKKNNTYLLSFRVEDATGVPVNLTNKIKSDGKNFKVCVSTPFGIQARATDSDGQYLIGLEYEIITSNQTGDGEMDFTIKYQNKVKNGSCEPGVVYFTCSMPFSVI